MSGFLMVNQICVPSEFIASMYAHFQELGTQGYEGVVLWAGVLQERSFEVTHLLFPEQELRKSPQGLSYSVSGEELHRLNVWLYQNRVRLIGQVHSHPAEAFHSEIDDDYPIVTTAGSLSVVVPDFGFSDNILEASACFRLLPGAGWVALTKEQKDSLLKITC